MKRREFLLSLLATGVPALPVWGGQTLPVGDDVAVPDETLSAAQADVAFTLDIYRSLAATGDDNMIVSGHSLMSAFLILAEGATGRAAEQIGSTLRLPDWAARPDADTPWNFAEFSNAVATLQRSMEPIGEEESAALQEQLDELNRQFEELNAKLLNDSGSREDYRRLDALSREIATISQQIDPYRLRFANAIWCDNGFPLSDDYAASVESIWGAAAFGCDFQRRPDAERIQINDWVAAQTEGRIEDLLAPDTISPLTRLVITNAMYFKGNWQSTFDESLTEDQPFTLADGEQVMTPLMADLDRECRYVELTPAGEVNEHQRTGDGWELPENPDGLKLLELPYRGGRLSMVVVLPNAVDGLGDIESRLDPETLSSWMNVMREQEVEVFLPRFTITRSYVLNESLQQLGLTAVFQPGGLLGLSDSPEARELLVSLVAQKAFIEVNEEGTEAAAATAIVADLTSIAEPRPKPQFRADHPFLYFIQDRETGAILFMGRLMKPEVA